MTTTRKIVMPRGDIFARLSGTTGAYAPLLNATSVTLTPKINKISVMSNGNVPGTLDEFETDRALDFEATLQSRHAANLSKFLLTAGPSEIAAATDVAVTLPVGGVGDTVDLGVMNVTSATFGSLVEGVDYTLIPRTGAVTYITARTSTQVGTVDHDAYTAQGVLAGNIQNWDLLIVSEKSGDKINLFKVPLSPSSAFEAIKEGNNVSTQTLSGSCLVDTSKPADALLGQYGTFKSVA